MLIARETGDALIEPFAFRGFVRFGVALDVLVGAWAAKDEWGSHRSSMLRRRSCRFEPDQKRIAVAIAAACWGLAIVAFGFAGRLWLALLCLAVAGASDMISGVFRMLIWNQTIPDHLRGRLAGIELISYHTGPMLGNAESGILASIVSIRTTVVSGGILCVLGTGLLLLALPGFRTYQGREGLVRKQEEEDARVDALDLRQS